LNVYFLLFRIFEQLALALKNIVALEFFTVLKYILLFRIFEELAVALKTEFALKFFKPGVAAAPASYAYGHLCFERRYHEQNSVIRLKSNILPPTNFIGPQDFWAGYATACRGKLPNLRADCSTVGLYRVIITWQ